MVEQGQGSEGSAGGAGGTAGTGQQSGGKPWFDGKVDAELIGHWDNKGWKKDDPINIAVEATKAARELQKHFGVPENLLVKLPKDNADEAGWTAVYQRLGAPKDAKGYDFSGVKLPDGSDLDVAFTDKMRNALYTAGVAKDKATSIVKAVVEHVAATDATDAAELASARAKQIAELQKNWGANFEFNRLTAMQGARRLGLDKEAVEAMESLPGMGYAKLMEVMRKIGVGTTEDTFVDAGQAGARPTTRQGAQATLTELQSDNEWTKRFLSGGVKERKQFDDLMLLIHGEAA